MDGHEWTSPSTFSRYVCIRLQIVSDEAVSIEHHRKPYRGMTRVLYVHAVLNHECARLAKTP